MADNDSAAAVSTISPRTNSQAHGWEFSIREAPASRCFAQKADTFRIMVYRAGAGNQRGITDYYK